MVEQKNKEKKIMIVFLGILLEVEGECGDSPINTSNKTPLV